MMIVLSFIGQGLRISIPYVLPAVGASISERGGVINIALEGMLLIGAFAATVTTAITGSILLGVIAAVAAGTIMAMLHGLASITAKVNQIVIGIALNLLAFGLTKFLCQVIFHSSSNSSRIAGLELWADSLRSVPWISWLFANPFLVGSLLLTLMTHVGLFRTRFGLRLRAVGEHPQAADTAGISVVRYRFIGILYSGALCGLGGAWLAFDQHSFTDGMTSGRGFIALAAMIIGKWKPIHAAVACLLFGYSETLVIQLQGTSFPTQFLQMIPYILTMVVLAGFIGKAVPPAADGIPYEKEQTSE